MPSIEGMQDSSLCFNARIVSALMPVVLKVMQALTVTDCGVQRHGAAMSTMR